MKKNPDTPVVQMDSVISRKGGKCLLTIHFVECSLMLVFLRDANTSKSVTNIINYLNTDLEPKVFKNLFQVVLTDNESEFSNPKGIEYRNTLPPLRTRVYYCDAGSSYQKGACEVNHELIRRVFPKGTSFDQLTQEDVTLMMSHINSYKRKKLNNRSPYETFSFYHGEEVLQKIGCSPVAPGDIMLRSTLLKKIIMNMPPTNHLLRNEGVDSPITKKSRGSRPPFDMLTIIIIQFKKLKIKLHLGYKGGIWATRLYVSVTKVAFRLQNFTS
ncbi:hypothetical protein M2148_001982 [Lachnospiraceae bacterium PF1-4]